ncbi:Mut7-C RNAse domain-containing protein [Methylacidiphilum caldifontis]|uniref:Twitching motility protein PilT n=1 Tax=Methylacidiphilum caldifontis TaxID=2795386 RepID=A0A4Y8PHG5_9BACT|nr:Mut7-C RNAse domain-containing protein [Methylacidiphilum caldifontis]TFE72071.1 twitching motility protein PilT [Methylacidiphilum caldifontis]
MKSTDSQSQTNDQGVEVTFRFYAKLNDFLPPWQRQKEIKKKFGRHTTLKDAIESLGIPHTEIALILVNGSAVGFDHKVSESARISVYPHFKSIDIGGLSPLRIDKSDFFKFVLDVHLGTLARYLRMLGFDALYSNDLADEKLAEISFDQQRILLTRDPGLLKRKKVVQGYFVRATEPRSQILELIREFQLKDKISPFGRCMRCNGLLKPISKEEINSDIPPRIKEMHSVFLQCQSCGRIYWKGSHYHKLMLFIDWILTHSY